MGDLLFQDYIFVGLSVFILGMSKGGFPIGELVAPLLVLFWPGTTDPARAAIGFMLPLLCIMDIVALFFYWRHIRWDKIRRILPATLAGVVAASLIFLPQTGHGSGISDRTFKLGRGLLGLSYVLYNFLRKRILNGLEEHPNPGPAKCTFLGFGAGLFSTAAHSAGPMLQMYLLPQKLDTRVFAGTTAGYFFLLNAVKLLPFAYFGRLQPDHLKLGALMLPIIPAGVATGFFLVRLMKSDHYIRMIYGVLLLTSLMLLWRARL
jgi:uncharacterized membrane protein YfcA